MMRGRTSSGLWAAVTLVTPRSGPIVTCHSEEEQPDFRAYILPTARKSGDLATTRNLGAGTADTSIRFPFAFQLGVVQ